MELRNVIFAVSLSFAILFGWSVIFDTPEEKQKRLERAESRDQTSTAPSVNAESNNIENISREDSIRSSKRIKIENENIIGSISLKGVLIDDITFKKYNETIFTNRFIHGL